MKGSLVIISFFIVGVLLSRWGFLPEELIENDFSMYALYVLMFLVGMSIGSDTKALKALKEQNLKILLVPLATILGTWAGSILVSFFLPGRSMTDCLAVGSGFGYYSLSSIFITEYKGAELGTIALAANVIREVITLVGAPLLVCWFGKLAPICSGGATTMDTTLPVITRFSGKEFVVVSIFHGFVVDFTVPFLVTFFAKLWLLCSFLYYSPFFLILLQKYIGKGVECLEDAKRKNLITSEEETKINRIVTERYQEIVEQAEDQFNALLKLFEKYAYEL